MKFFTILFATATLLAMQIPLRAQTGGATEEQSLIVILQSDQSAHNKDAACARLKRIGTEASIPALAALLTDDQLSHSARYALEPMPSEKAGQALIEALPKTTGGNRIGIINSLGERGDKRAVAPLAAFLSDSDTTPVMAAAEALGKIGGQEAQKALDTSLNQATGPVRDAVVDALLRCATATQDRAEFQKLYQAGNSEAVRVAAYRGMIETSGQEALKLVTKGVVAKDSAAQTAALQMAREIQTPGATAALAKLLPRVSGPFQIALIDALDQRGDPDAVPALLSLAAKAEPDVRVACLNALGNLGGESAVATLAKFAAAGGDDEKNSRDRTGGAIGIGACHRPARGRERHARIAEIGRARSGIGSRGFAARTCSAGEWFGSSRVGSACHQRRRQRCPSDCGWHREFCPPPVAIEWR